MEYLYSIKETHTRSITALGFNPARRELLIGCEDGVVKVWESETGCSVQTMRAHQGWVTSFLYWPTNKLVLSCGHDGTILFWSGNCVTDKVFVDCAVYAITINPRKRQILCGCADGIRLFDLDEPRISGHYINMVNCYHAREHTDIVKCIAVHDTRVYSAGFDQRLIIYDSSYTGEKEMLPTVVINRAHDAGINNLVIARDNENNSWIVTGGFDKCVKIWSTDGKVVHKIDNFMTSISGVVYIPRNRTIWVTGGAPYAWIYDPKSGENISEFCGTFVGKENEKYQLQLMKFYPEMNMVIASTSRRHLITWKYLHSACITTLNNDSPVESLTYTRKLPILLFSGDHNGELMKWERKQSNQFAYSREPFKAAESMQRLLRKKLANRQRVLDMKSRGSEEENGSSKSHVKKTKPMLTNAKKTFLRLHYEEDIDILVAACEDGNIYIFGFDERAVQVLLNMDSKSEKEQINDKFAILVDRQDVTETGSSPGVEEDDNKVKGDDVTKRVAGFTCRHILMEHHSVVTCFAVVPPFSKAECSTEEMDSTNDDNLYYLITGGWDQRLCVWNLFSGDLVDVFRNANSKTWEERELAADDVILDMCFCPERREFAYSCADNLVYIRRFSPVGTELRLLNTLKGHESEITTVKWSASLYRWITASEDFTIRLWDGKGFNECLATINTGGPVYALCLDAVNDVIVSAVGNEIKVFDPSDLRLLQTNAGHLDSIRSIVYIPEMGQYVTASWDGHINLWTAWSRSRCLSSRMQFRPISGDSHTARTDSMEVEKTGDLEEKDEGEEAIDGKDVNVPGEVEA